MKKESKTPEEILKELDEKPQLTKKQIKKENKILRNIFIGIGIIIILIVGLMLFFNSVRHFTYEGVKFEVVQKGELTLYNTKLPVYKSGQDYADYNFFLRNDPRELDVKFEGGITFKKDVVLNSEESFNCDGYGIIAIANLKQLYEVLGSKVIKDENASCDSLGRYMYINLKQGNETKIEQVGFACYNIIINDCEILEGTEKFMVETFIKANEQLNSN